MEGNNPAPKYQGGAVGEPFFDLLNPSGVTGRNASGSQASGRIEDLNQGDNILPSYDFHNTRVTTPAGKSVSPSSSSDSKGALSAPDNPTWKPPNAAGQVQTSGGSTWQQASPSQESQDRLMVTAVDKVMKKYADNMLRMLEGINGRLENLEESVQHLESQLVNLQKTSGDNHGEVDGHSRMLENMVREVQRSLQVLRDKQEIAEQQAELAKLHLPKPPGGGVASQEPSPLPVPVSPVASTSLLQPANGAPSAPLVPQPGSEMAPAPSYIRPQLMQLPAPPQSSQQPMPSSTNGMPYEQSQLQLQLQPQGPPPQPQASQQQPQHYHQAPAQQPVGQQQAQHMPQQASGLQYGQQPAYHQMQQQPSSGMPPPPTQGGAPQMMPQQYGQQLGGEHPPYMGNNYASQQQPQLPPHPPPPQQQLQEAPRMSNSVPPQYGMPMPPSYGQDAPYGPPPGLHRQQILPPAAQPATTQGGYPRLQTALPVSSPSGPPTAPSTGPPLSTSRVPIDKVIDDVAAMGFSKAQVGEVVKKLTENGQSVDLNVVLDKLMNGGATSSRGGSQGAELAGKPTGWFGGR